MGLMKAPNPQTGAWEGVDALAINDDKGERVTVARIKATESQLAETVKEVNGAKPVNGKIMIPIPEVDTSKLTTKPEFQALEVKVNSQASDAPKGIYSTFAELQTAHPTGTPGKFIVGESGTEKHWYIWFNGKWVDGGVYQGIGIADNSINEKHLSFIPVKGAVSKNLFDKSTAIKNYYVMFTNGHLDALTDYYATVFIPVQPNTKYTKNTNDQIAFYDFDKHYLSGLESAAAFTTPANCYYLRTAIHLSYLDTFQIELGNVSTSYESASPKIDKSAIPNNFIDQSMLKFSPVIAKKTKNLFNKNTAVKDKYVMVTNGSLDALLNYYTSDWIPVLPNTEYKRVESSIVVFYEESKKYISGLDNASSFTTPPDCYCIKISGNQDYLDREQVEIGTVSTTYESYGDKLPSSVYGNGTIGKEALNFSPTANYKNFVVVAKSGGDYKTINEALNKVSDSVDNKVTIWVMPGVYVESVRLISRYITLVGVNKDTCIITTFTNDYYNPPVDLGPNSHIINLTVIADDDGVTTPHPSLPSYAVHADLSGRGFNLNLPKNQGLARIQNCVLISKNNSPLGIGVTTGETILIEDTECYSPNYGCVYAHNYQLEQGRNQRLIFKNCVLHTDADIAVWRLLDANWGTGGAKDSKDSVFTFINNIAWSEVRGQKDILNVSGYEPLADGCITGYVKLGKGSFGNNIAALNA